MREPVKAEGEEESKDVEKPKPEIVKKLADEWDEEDEEEQEKKRAEEEAKQPGGELMYRNSLKDICEPQLLQKEMRRQLKLAKRPLLHPIHRAYLSLLATPVSPPRRSRKMWTRTRLLLTSTIFSMTPRT